MNKPFAGRIVLGAIAALAGGMSNQANSACYPVAVHPPSQAQSFAVVHFGKTAVSGFNVSMPPSKVCASIPDVVRVEYSVDGGVTMREANPVHIQQNLPKDFVANSARLISFRIDASGDANVTFRMRLSDLTTKYISHEETGSERQQRLKDEALWQAINNGQPELVRKLIREGASTFQPWMVDPEDQAGPATYAVFNAAMYTRNPEIVDAVLSANTIHWNEDHDSILWFRFGGWTSGIEYVGADLARVLLDHGANPNAGRKVEFDWKHTDWRSRPGMPTNADVKPPPMDRLLYIAAKNLDINLVRLLIDHNADIHFRIPVSREPPGWWVEGEWFLDWASREASPEIKSILLARKSAL